VILFLVWLLLASALGFDRVITNDPGGRVGDYLASAYEPGIEIQGFCASACTLALSAPGVCISPDAQLVFHAATVPLGTRIIYEHYPHAIQNWIEARGGLTTRLLYMTGREAISLGVRRCS